MTPARRVDEGWLIVKTVPQEGLKSHFGCSARRGCGPAVTRNRIKRWVREAFRRHAAQFPKGLDFMAVILTSPPKLSFGKVEETLLSLKEKIDLPPQGSF